jgi:cytochrome c-type biogenesis protein CcmH/NrfG
MLVKVTAHYHRKEFEQMVALMKEVTRMRRRTGDWDLLGKYLYQSGRREEAQKAFQKSLDIDPTNRPVRLMLEQFNR